MALVLASATACTTNATGANQAYADDAGRTEFSVFERVSPGGPWLKSIRATSTAHVLSTPVVAGGAAEEASTAQLGRVESAVSDLMRYIESGTDCGRLTDVMLAQNDVDYFWARAFHRSAGVGQQVGGSPVSTRSTPTSTTTRSSSSLR